MNQTQKLFNIQKIHNSLLNDIRNNQPTKQCVMSLILEIKVVIISKSDKIIISNNLLIRVDNCKTIFTEMTINDKIILNELVKKFKKNLMKDPNK